MKRILFQAIIVLSVLLFAACSNNSITSSTTGWKYDYKAKNAFSNSLSITASATPPGMVAIEGWSYSVDDMEEYVTASRRVKQNDPNTRRVLSVNSFYMDQREVRNIDWREYLVWLNLVYGKVAPDKVEKARPNMKEWVKGLSDNEPFLQNYFTHPSFNDYPVVCISWEQAADYCKWRTDRANELILIRSGAIKAPDFDAIARLETLEEVEKAIFSTERYFGSAQENLSKTAVGLFPNFRLPSEDEWEFAAYARKKTDAGDVMKVYPWSDITVGKLSPRQRGQQMANYNSRRGFTGKSDGFSRTVPAGKFAPNDFGLYNMAGNVNEWVADQYIGRGNINKIDSVEVLDAFLPDYHRYNDSRVYKGGSWKDPVYWLHPASRRYLDKSASANDIGFRCAMSMVPGVNVK